MKDLDEFEKYGMQASALLHGIAQSISANPIARSRPVEIGVIGREGVTGIPIILGAEASSHSIYMQVAGNAWRIDPFTLLKAED